MKKVKFDLTDRELDVLVLLAMGKSNKDIAQILCIVNSTVKAHLTSIFKKLHVENRTQAAIKAKDVGIIRHQDSKRP